MAKYVYPAIFTQEETGFSVWFPDLEGCYTCGDDLNAIVMAEDVLAYVLYDYEREGKEIPKPSARNMLQLESEQDFVNDIACDTIEYAKLHNNKAVKKTLTIPEWLNEEAMALGVNFSQVLQEALLSKINAGR